MNKIIISFIITLGLVVFLFYPVCGPLSAGNLQTMNVPIEQRTDRDFYLRVFQKKNGEWYHCKIRISRIFFM